jgi:outer membrane lipoprotein-sorting protein
MKKTNHLFLYNLLFILIFSGCTSDPLKVNVSDIKLNFKTVRLDEAVFSTDWRNPVETNSELYTKYGGYYKFYAQFILNNQTDIENPKMGKYMAGFAQDKTMREFYHDIEARYGGEKFQPFIGEFEMAFKHYKYYFPKEPTPTLLTYQSGFNYKIVPNDTLLGIGLEWYLGSENELIKRLSTQVYPAYEKAKMRPVYLVVDGVKGFLKVKYQEKMIMDNLLKVMIFYGKILYLTDAMVHDKPDAVKMDYTQNEWDWCVENQKLIWIYLAENNLLFNSSMLEISKWVNDGPFTSGLPQESPSRVGIWIGWQMVRQYMEKKPSVTIPQLMDLEDDSAILNNYKPD